jgi:hypothetical protein
MTGCLHPLEPTAVKVPAMAEDTVTAAVGTEARDLTTVAADMVADTGQAMDKGLTAGTKVTDLPTDTDRQMKGTVTMSMAHMTDQIRTVDTTRIQSTHRIQVETTGIDARMMHSIPTTASNRLPIIGPTDRTHKQSIRLLVTS